MHIYDKQCEIMQTKSMEELKLPDSVFLQGDGRSSVLKTLKTTKTKETKMPVSQIFPIPILPTFMMFCL